MKGLSQQASLHLLLIASMMLSILLESQIYQEHHLLYVQTLSFGFALAMVHRFGFHAIFPCTLGFYLGLSWLVAIPQQQSIAYTLCLTVSLIICLLTYQNLNRFLHPQQSATLQRFAFNSVLVAPLVITLITSVLFRLQWLDTQSPLLTSTIHVTMGALAGVMLITLPLHSFSLQAVINCDHSKLLVGALLVLVCLAESSWLQLSPFPGVFVIPPLLTMIWLGTNTNLACTSLLSTAYSLAVLKWQTLSLYVPGDALLHEIAVWAYVCGLQAIVLYVAMRNDRAKLLIEKLSASVDASALGVWDWQLATQQISVNSHWNSMLGRAPSQTEWPRDTIRALIHPDDADKLDTLYQQLKQGEERFNLQARLRHQDGSWHTFQIFGAVVQRNMQGDPVRICGTQIDITEQVSDRAFVNSLKLAFENATGGLMVVKNDAQFTVLYANQAIANLTGFWLEELINQPCWLFDAEVAMLSDRQLLAIRNGQSIEVTQKSVKKCGRAYWANIIIEPIQHTQPQFSEFLLHLRDVTEERKANLLAEQHTARLQHLVSQAPGAMFELQLSGDGQFIFNYCSEGMSALFGLTPSQLQLDSRLLFNAIHPDYTQRLREGIYQARRSMSVWRQEFKVIRPTDGWREAHASPVLQDDGNVLWYGFFADITIRKSLENAVRTVANQLQLAQQHAHIGYWSMDTARQEIYWSDIIFQFIGRAPEAQAFSLTKFYNLVMHQDLHQVQQVFSQAARRGSVDVEYRIQRSDGKVIWLHQFGDCPQQQSDDKQIQGMIQDITQRKTLELKLSTQALTDELTGIANRRAFITQLEQEWQLFLRDPQLHTSIIILDIDYFKKVNDQHGHDTGDAMLQHVTKVISEHIRSSDTFGRLGGEEFAILTRNANAQQASQLADKLRMHIETTPLHVTKKLQIAVTMSFGVAQFTQPDNSGKWEATDMLFAADKALYHAKNNGRNQVRLFDWSSANGSDSSK